MTDYREILRLDSLGTSQRGIASEVQSSRNMDVGLVYAGLSFKDRQHRLEWYAWSKSQPALTAEKQPSLPAA